MVQRKSPPDAARIAKITEELRADAERRRSGYRERALGLFPHVCGSCGREFSGKRLRELTVHHKDHNHDNNPPDGGNWELLCLFCHDHEHEKHKLADYYGGSRPTDSKGADTTFSMFDDLDKLVGTLDGESDAEETPDNSAAEPPRAS